VNAILTVDRLHFTYGGSATPVICNVSFDVNEGELMLMVGPSGGGKTTLLRCMNGLVPHFHGGVFAGTVVVAGIDTRSRQPRDLASVAGMVFQEPEAQAVADNVEDEIVFGLENLGCDRARTRKRLEEALDALGIAHLRRRTLRTLSGGELQRVAIASVLTMQPRVLLLDEPTSQLDPQAAHDVLSVAADLRAELGLTVVVCEHRLDRLIQYADRVMEVPGDGSVNISVARDAMALLASAPPVIAIGRALGWAPLPLSVAEARRFAGPRAVSAPTNGRAAPAPGDGVVSVRRLSVRLGETQALRDVSLELHEGEIVALMGRNGAGKTTLLRALAGLIDPAAHAVTFARDEFTRARYRHCAYVAQNPSAMLYHATVAREVEDVLRGTGRVGTVSDALDEWGLSALASRDPRDLSVGERQRVALAAMLAGAPRLILLDEPTRGMDADTRDLLIANLHRRRAAGATIVLASHDVELAASCAGRVVLLAEGEVIADGRAHEILADSITFSTQANKLFGGGVLTVEDALAHVGSART
jgi:energy-coupling factor transport system ATP-binding protein